jgi:hypothetical protein
MSRRQTAALVAALLFASAIPADAAATIRGLPLPDGATIDAEAGGAAVTANARGDVVANAALGDRRRIVVWDVQGHRRILEPPPGGQYDQPEMAFTGDGVVAPDGTVYGIGGYPFSGAYSGVRTRFFAWRAGPPLEINGRACAGRATDAHPTAVAADGRVALAGGYDSDVMSIDAIEAGVMPPTASILDGPTCHALDFGWISALDGGFAAGRRGYQNGKPIPSNVNAQSQKYVAVRWTGTHAEELGSGVALGVNAKGDCVGSDAPPGIHGAYSISSSGPAGTVTHRYGIDNIHAVVWHGNVMTRLSPEATRSIAYAINESGRTVVGTMRDAGGQHAVRWRDGKAELLDNLLPRDAGWQLITAYAITPDNAIVGVGRHNNARSAFILSAPAPELTRH